MECRWSTPLRELQVVECIEMVDERIDHSDMGEMSLDGIFECSREPHFGRPRSARAGRCDDLAFTTRSSRRRERERESCDATEWRGAARALDRGGADEARERLCAAQLVHRACRRTSGT
mmetsp:Transcript_154243/g.493361  ORF Transcript_154243/g.493361 Transcript_154243/m.493361 type:complete len:119 (-) Transcript_154243:1953-2309(-)